MITFSTYPEKNSVKVVASTGKKSMSTYYWLTDDPTTNDQRLEKTKMDLVNDLDLSELDGRIATGNLRPLFGVR